MAIAFGQNKAHRCCQKRRKPEGQDYPLAGNCLCSIIGDSGYNRHAEEGFAIGCPTPEEEMGRDDQRYNAAPNVYSQIKGVEGGGKGYRVMAQRCHVPFRVRREGHP